MEIFVEDHSNQSNDGRVGLLINLFIKVARGMNFHVFQIRRKFDGNTSYGSRKIHKKFENFSSSIG
jgi:hypothetical protein